MSFQERIIDTIANDFELIKSFDNAKEIRKECSLLLKRVESAKKLFVENQLILQRLADIERQIEKFRLNM